MSLRRILKALTKLGLSQREAGVYVYLAIKGPQKAENIAETLKLSKQHFYLILLSLQNKRIVKVICEYTVQFSAVPFETALDLLSEAQRKEAQCIEENKEEIIVKWRTVTKKEK